MPVGLPSDVPAGLAQVEWCATFSGPARAALHALKYRGQRRLAGPLGEAVGRRWAVAGVGGNVLTWVPVHVCREHARGYYQAELLAREAASAVGLPVAGMLTRGQRTRAMHGLGRRERSINVASAFTVNAGAQKAVRGR